VIKHGLLIICEIKSPMSEADMVVSGRKVKFYKRQHQSQVARVLLISLMVDKSAHGGRRQDGHPVV